MVIRIRDKADLWTLLMPPTVWALHFLFCYLVAAVHCAKEGGINLTEPSSGVSFAALGEVRPLVAIGTAVALALILVSAWQAWRHWGAGTEDPPHDAATPEDRQHFLGLATLLLSGLSFASVIFIALPAFLITDCR